MKRLLFMSILIAPALAMAAPETSDFKRVKKNRTTRIANCDVNGVEGAVTLRFTMQSRRIHVSVPRRFKRQSPAIGSRGAKFVACGASSTDPSRLVVFTAASRTGAVTEHDIALTDFEEGTGDTGGNLGAACKSVRSFPGSFIYKTIGSSHFSDIRRNTIGLIMEPGAGVPTPSCIDVLAKNGQKISDVGLYARGAGWHARYYGGIGCGDAVNGSALLSRAMKAAGSDDVYFRIGTTCYGPADANRCIGSSQC